jgi:hypothetical protein
MDVTVLIGLVFHFSVAPLVDRKHLQELTDVVLRNAASEREPFERRGVEPLRLQKRPAVHAKGPAEPVNCGMIFLQGRPEICPVDSEQAERFKLSKNSSGFLFRAFRIAVSRAPMIVSFV